VKETHRFANYMKIPFTQISLQSPSKLFMVKKNAVNALPVAALIVVLFPVLVANFLTVSLYLIITIFLFLRSSKIIVTRDLLTTAMIMLSGVLIMAYSYDIKPVITFPMEPPVESSNITSMLLTCVICFVVFIIGYFYSFTVKKPLSFLRYVFLYQWVLVGLYFIVAHGAFFLGNSLLLGAITIVLLPYMYLVFDGKPKLRFAFSLAVLLYLKLILTRTAFGAAVLFFLTYYLYPYLIGKKIIYKMFFLFFIIILILSIFVYALSGFDFSSASDISVIFFGGKGQYPGRDLMWPELLSYILDKPLFGYGINQDSGYLRSSAAILGYRGLDSHNIYLESLLRGGILLLSFFIILIYRIWGSLYSINNNKMSRIAASGFMAFLFLGAGIPIGLIDNIVLNTLLWFYWGIASGNTWIKNHEHVVPA
jgi:O-antigen ligase